MVPIEVVATSLPVESSESSDPEARDVNQVAPVWVKSVLEALVKVLRPVKELLLERRVEDAATSVKVPPAVIGVLLMVASVPKSIEEGSVLVAETAPEILLWRKPTPMPSVSAEVLAPALKVWSADQLLASESRLVPVTRQLPAVAKQPVAILKPTLDVEVAEPLMLRPVTVVVPKPVAETESAVEDAEVTASKMLPVVLPQIVRLEYGVEVPMPTFPTV